MSRNNEGINNPGIPFNTAVGTGTVTSVGLALPVLLFAVSGSPITTSGTISATLQTQAANTFFAGPTTGADATPTMRSIVAADIPNLDASKIVTGTIATARLASGTANSSTFLRGDQTWATPAGAGTVTSVAMTVPSILSVSGSPVTSSGTLAVTLATQSSNLVFSGPSSGAAAAPTFRSLVAQDLGTGTADSTTFLRGDLTWATPAGGSPAGSTKRVQYNNAGVFAASDSFLWDETAKLLYIGDGDTESGSAFIFNDAGDTLLTMEQWTESNALVIDAQVRATDGRTTNLMATWVTRSSTAAATPIMTYYARQDGGTPAADWGMSHAYYLQSTTTTDREAAAMLVAWSDPTHATRTSYISFSTVESAAGIAESFRILAGLNGIRIGTTSNYIGLKPSGAGTQTYAFPATDGTSNQVLTTNGSGVLSWATVGGTGTVTSVAMTVPSIMSVTGSPVTTSGTLAVSFATQSANLVFSGPASGAAATPTFRALVSDDVPSLDAAKITTGIFNPVFLGTGTPDNTKYLRGDGAWAVLPSGSVTSVAMTAPAEISVGGSPITTSGTLALTWATQTANTVFAGPTTGIAATPAFRALVAADIPSLDAAKITSGLMATARLGSGTADSSSYLRGDQTWATLPSGGTVTSVALTAPAEISVGGSPITTSGTLALTWATQTANTVFAGATSGGAATPAFRALVAADIPSLDAAKITTGTMATARLGSGTADATTFLRGDQTYAVPATAPGGSTTQIQFNNAGTLSGSSFNTWDNTNGQLAVGSVTANTNPVVVITQNTTVTNTVQEVLRVRSNSSGTATTNYGLAVGFYGETSTTDNTYMGEMNYQWSVATHASRNSAIVFKAVVSGTTTEVLRLNDSQNGGSSNMTIAATNIVTINATQTISTNGTVSGAITATSTVGATGAHGAIYGTMTLNTGFSTTAAQTSILGTLTSGTSTSTMTAYLSAAVRGTTNHPGANGIMGVLTQANTTTGGAAPVLALITADTNNNSSTLKLIEASRQGGTPAGGYGAAIYFSLSSSTQVRDAGYISCEWSTATDASRTSRFIVATVDNAGALTNRLQINSQGDFAYSMQTTNTNAAATVQTYSLNSTGTAAAGFGHQVLFQAESSTTNARDLVAWQYTWTDATDATRTSGATLLLSSSGSMTSFLTLTGTTGVLNLPQSSQTIAIGGTQVIGTRITGWSAWTGTANRASKDTSTATLVDVAQTVKAIVDDLRTHGLFGT